MINHRQTMPVTHIHRFGIHWLRKVASHFSLPETGLEGIQPWRDFVLWRLLSVCLVLGAITCVPSLMLALAEGRTSIAVIDSLAFAWISFIYFNKKLSYTLRVWSFIGLLYLLGVFFLSLIGSVSQVYLMAVPVMTALLLGLWPAVGALFLNAVTLLLFNITGQADMHLHAMAGHALMGTLVITLNFVFINAIITISTAVLLQGLRSALAVQHQMAYYDSLCGLPNRRMLQERLSETLARQADGGAIGAVVFIDLDNFKDVNDSRGHTVGDRLLIMVAQRIHGVLGSDDMVARLGGDEFVVLLAPLSHSPDEASALAQDMGQRIRIALNTPFDLDGNTHNSSASLGITLLNRQAQSLDDVLREADIAMYHAKSDGKNRIALFACAMQEQIAQRLALEADLAVAIDKGQLALYLQPQFSASEKVIGGELLLRWQHPQRGNVPPSLFIPIAEQNGQILVLGKWVMQQGCLAAVALQQAGRFAPVSINVSPSQFHQADFIDGVRHILQQTGAAPEMLIFEVTEGLLIENVERTIARMRELSTLGIRFSIDDFGTGYSSLSYLRRLPLYELKIDSSFVRDTPEDASATAIVTLILSMARELNLRVVAEGVETRAQADFLIANGCDAMQGFLFATPQPLQHWLEQPQAQEPLRLSALIS